MANEEEFNKAVYGTNEPGKPTDEDIVPPSKEEIEDQIEWQEGRVKGDHPMGSIKDQPMSQQEALKKAMNLRGPESDEVKEARERTLRALDELMDEGQ